MRARLTPPPFAAYQQLMDLALSEDIGTGDITSELVIPESLRSPACVEARNELTVCGLFLVEAVVRAVNPEIQIEHLKAHGFEEIILATNQIPSFSTNFEFPKFSAP